jgi:hypothetical protein
MLSSAESPIPTCVYLEVQPLEDVILSPAFTKFDLIQRCGVGLDSRLRCHWEKVFKTMDGSGTTGTASPVRLSGLISDLGGTSAEEENCFTVSLDPYNALTTSLVPCKIWAVAFLYGAGAADAGTSTDVNKQTWCTVSEGTFVKILPYSSLQQDIEKFRGEMPWDCSPSTNDLVLACNEPETIQDIALRLSLQLKKSHFIGTAPDAIERNQATLRRHASCEALRRRSTKQPAASTDRVSFEDQKGTSMLDPNSFLNEGGLCVFDDVPGSGKSALVTAVAFKVLRCGLVHVISAAMLFAKYGTGADAAFESIIHQLLLAGAVRKRKVCIILDDLHNFVPGPHSQGDPSGPVLNAMGK